MKEPRAEIALDLPALADHEVLDTSFQWGAREERGAKPPLRMATTVDQTFQSTLQLECEALGPPSQRLPDNPSPGHLDDYTKQITRALNTALEASTKRAYPRPSGHKWWDQEYREAVISLRRARDPSTP